MLLSIVQLSKKSVVILLAVFIGLTSCAQKKIGVQLYSFRNELSKDVGGTLEKIKKMGIDEVEGGELYGLSPNVYKNLLVENGLTMIGVYADFNELESNL